MRTRRRFQLRGHGKDVFPRELQGGESHDLASLVREASSKICISCAYPDDSSTILYVLMSGIPQRTPKTARTHGCSSSGLHFAVINSHTLSSVKADMRTAHTSDMSCGLALLSVKPGARDMTINFRIIQRY